MLVADALTFSLRNVTVDTKRYTDVTWNVTNNCKYHVSYVAFGRGELLIYAPPDGSTYRGQFGVVYNVVYTSFSGNTLPNNTHF